MTYTRSSWDIWVGLGDPVVQIRQPEVCQEAWDLRYTQANKSHTGISVSPHLWADLRCVLQGGKITPDPWTTRGSMSLWEDAEKE